MASAINKDAEQIKHLLKAQKELALVREINFDDDTALEVQGMMTRIPEMIKRLERGIQWN